MTAPTRPSAVVVVVQKVLAAHLVPINQQMIARAVIATVLDNLPREVMAKAILEMTGLKWDTATAVRKAMCDDWTDAAIAAARKEILGHD